MNRFIEHIGNLYSIILTILTLFLGEHWILFMVLLLLNIIDTLTGWIKSRINNKENSMAGLKGIMKKYKIAVIGGDGTGPEVAREAVKVLDAAKAKFREAYNWVNRRDEEYIFGFESSCEALGIDPEYLRLGLINACVSRIPERKKARRSF